ncbi:MAG: hypothetical protein ACTSVV_05425 [Promethearchaeota archaeon]
MFKQEKKYLEKLLSQFTDLEKYRSLSLRISDIHHISVEKLVDDMILGFELRDGAGEEVEIAIKTLKKCERNTQF